LTDQRRNKAMPCSYVDQYTQQFSSRGTSWVWTKSRQPNVMDYYSEDFGLILTLSRTRKLRLKRFIGKENMKSFAWLIEATENDSEFFNRMNSSMLASG